MLTRNSGPKILVIANLLAYAAVLTVNILSNALPLNGRSAEEISDALPSFFTPAGYTFSIWGLIYLGLLGFVVYQALPKKQGMAGQIGWLFVASSVVNIAWLFSWHYGFYAVSVLMMISLLLILIAIYRRLDSGRANPALTAVDNLVIRVPFSLYLGWISVATIANIASVVAYWGWNGFGLAGQVWSAIMMLVASAVAGLLLFNRRDFAYGGVLVWALFGIRAAYPNEAVISNTALVAAGLIILFALIGYWRTNHKETPIPPQAKTA